MEFFLYLTKAISKPFFVLGNFFITTYGVFLKLFLKLNGGYWGKIGIGKYSTIEKKRNFYILPFYILLALLFGFLSLIYWYYVVLFIPLWIERYFTVLSQWDNILSKLIALTTFFCWLLILTKTK